ncbi:hypothetical protein H8959_003548, partial [Pygathrix nigripes]
VAVVCVSNINRSMEAQSILRRKGLSVRSFGTESHECTDFFDVIFTCEESVYDTVVEDLCSREQQTLQPVHVINMDIEDSLESATLGAFLICELCQCL